MAAFLASRLYYVLTDYWRRPPHLIPGTTTNGKRTTAAASQEGNTAESCRYRLDNTTSATVTLPDGRELGYAQYGSQPGRAVLYIHGLPGSRIEATIWEELAVRMGVRMISVDRPGYGWSSPHPDRRLLDYAKDMQHLAERLELEEYSVLGVSGGGPYALACAASMPPDRLKGVAIVCGMGLPDMSKRGMSWGHWFGFTVGYRHFPGVIRWYISRDPWQNLDYSDEERLELFEQGVGSLKAPRKEIEVFKDKDIMRASMRSSREAFSQGFEGLLQDGKLICMDPGFRIEDIRRDLPVHLWYGEHDTSVPAIHGRQTAARLGRRAQLHIEDETHSSVVVNCRERILRDLLVSMSTRVGGV